MKKLLTPFVFLACITVTYSQVVNIEDRYNPAQDAYNNGGVIGFRSNPRFHSSSAPLMYRFDLSGLDYSLIEGGVIDSATFSYVNVIDGWRMDVPYSAYLIELSPDELVVGNALPALVNPTTGISDTIEVPAYPDPVAPNAEDSINYEMPNVIDVTDFLNAKVTANIKIFSMAMQKIVVEPEQFVRVGSIMNSNPAHWPVLTLYFKTNIPPTPPVANAGEDQVVNAGDLVYLDGSATDANPGTEFSYAWTVPAPERLSDPTKKDPVWKAPFVQNDTDFELLLKVNDGGLDSENDTVTITVKAVTGSVPVTINPVLDGYNNPTGLVDVRTLPRVTTTIPAIFKFNIASLAAIVPDSAQFSFVTVLDGERKDSSFLYNLFEYKPSDWVNDGPFPLTDSISVSDTTLMPGCNSGDFASYDEFLAAYESRTNIKLLNAFIEGKMSNKEYLFTVGLSKNYNPLEPNAVDEFLRIGSVTNSRADVWPALTIYTASYIAPKAKAGLDQVIICEDPVEIDGSNSEGFYLSYNWTVPEGITIADPTTPVLNFTAPILTEITNFEFILEVGDGSNYSRDTVLITIKPNTKPVADAGEDFSAKVNTQVTITGKGTDSEQTELAYAWIVPEGITVADTSLAEISFTAPDVASETQYNFTLIVSDGRLTSDPDEVVVTVKPNNKPVAATEGDQTVNPGDFVLISALYSSDDTNDPLTYHWSVPEGIILFAVPADSSSLSFYAPSVDVTSTFDFILTVNDGELDSDPVTTSITVVSTIGINNSGIPAFTVFPNPANDMVNLVYALGGEKTVTIHMLEGKMVKAWRTGADEETINLENLPQGYYIISVSNSGSVYKNVLVKE